METQIFYQMLSDYTTKSHSWLLAIKTIDKNSNIASSMNSKPFVMPSFKPLNLKPMKSSSSASVSTSAPTPVPAPAPAPASTSASASASASASTSASASASAHASTSAPAPRTARSILGMPETVTELPLFMREDIESRSSTSGMMKLSGLSHHASLTRSSSPAVSNPDSTQYETMFPEETGLEDDSEEDSMDGQAYDADGNRVELMSDHEDGFEDVD